MRVMKINNIIRLVSFCFCAVAVLSCEVTENLDEHTADETLVHKIFHATIEDGGMTKTMLDENVVDGVRGLMWDPGDEIGIGIHGSTFRKFTNICTEATSNGVFEGEISESNTYYAIYPWRDNMTMTTEIFVNIPSRQTYRANSFDINMAPMVGRGNNEEPIHFQNLCGILTLNLKGTDKISSITLSAKDARGNKAFLSGDFSVDMGYETFPYPMPTEEALTDIILDCNDGVQLDSETETSFNVIIPPGKYYGLELLIVTSDGKFMKKSTSNTLEIKRSVITKSRGFEFEDNFSGTFVNLNTHGHSNCYVVSSAGVYSFDATVIGNGEFGMVTGADFHTDSPDIAPVSVDLLWEDRAGLIGGYAYDAVAGKVKFISTSNEGNALFAVKDAEGNILWSWHIWMTDQPADQTYVNSAGTFVVQDRNLGATRADRGVGDQWKESTGIEYFRGRKDPFIGGLFTNNNSVSTIPESIKNPTVTPVRSTATRYGFWMESYKTIYDPCPVGYMVASAYIWDGFSINTTIGEFDNGWHFIYDGTNSTWYPNKSRGSESGTEYWNLSYMWHSTSWHPTLNSNPFYFNSSTVGGSTNIMSLWEMHQVRCMKDETHVDLAFPLIEMVGAKNVTPESASLIFDIASEGASEITDIGVIYSTTPGVSSGNGTKVTRTGEENIVEVTGLTEGTKYYAVAYATNSYGTTYSKEIVFYTEFANCTNLSKYGTSNCYIVTKPGAYTFDAIVKGNGNESICNDEALRLGFSAIVLWETNNTDTFIEVEEIIRNVTYDAGYVRFDATGVPGNALIAVKDSSGTILWSWHIWSCDFDPYATANTYISGAVLMDRNLGALNVEKNDVRSYGLFYQWGRKDPSVGPLGKNGNYFAVTAPADAINYVSATTSNNTLTFTVNNPTTVIDGSTWNNEDYLWSSEKTIYDPCPIGWRIPDKSAWEGVSTSDYMINEPYSVPAAYCPVIGITEGYAYVQYSSDWLHIWSTSRSEYFASNGNSPSNDIFSARDVDNQMSVRCMRDE